MNASLVEDFLFRSRRGNLSDVTSAAMYLIIIFRIRVHRAPYMSSTTPGLPFPRPPPNYHEFPDPTTQSEKNAYRSKGASKYYDPCGVASENSMKCLDQNNFDKSKCREAFSAYRECKRIWVCECMILRI
jgi:cytochrome c oxidase assembly protein subunit 23